MMNAEVTAENRPAYNLRQHEWTKDSCKTYKYQRCVQILVVFLYELLIVLLRFLAVVLIEPSPMVLVRTR